MTKREFLAAPENYELRAFDVLQNKVIVRPCSEVNPDNLADLWDHHNYLIFEVAHAEIPRR